MKKMQVFIFIIAFICFVGSGGYLAKYFYERHVSEKNMDAVKELLVDEVENNEETILDENNESILARYSKLKEENPDFAGWISIPGTTIDYPVMYIPEDNDTYLYANFKKEWDAAGTPFIDGSCTLDPVSDNLIIYGHHMNDKSMFEPLMNYKDPDFYEAHKTISFDTLRAKGSYEVVAVILTRALYTGEEGFRYYGYFNFSNEEEFNYYWQNIQSMSLYETDTEPNYGDKLITLSTCEYSQEDGRLAVIAVKK